MKNRKLGIIGGSGLYKMEGFEKTKWKKVKTSWGQPSDDVMTAQLNGTDICFIPCQSERFDKSFKIFLSIEHLYH